MDIRKHFFSRRCTNDWNMLLPQYVVLPILVSEVDWTNIDRYGQVKLCLTSTYKCNKHKLSTFVESRVDTTLDKKN